MNGAHTELKPETPRRMTAKDLVALLDLAPLGDDRFAGHSAKNGWRRVFGGQVLAQALVAAERTVVGRAPHSLHAYFLLGGDPHIPIIFEVERLRDGRSFTTRRIVARQNGEPIFVMTASFQVPETGFDHAAPVPKAPPPEVCVDPRLAIEMLDGPARFRMKGMLDTIWPIDFRPTDIARYAPQAGREPRQNVWVRIGEPLPNDPAVQRAALLYLSDFSLIDAALVTHGRTIYDSRIQIASLDHAMWLHRPARADDWLLYVEDSPSASGGRGLVRGLLYARDGTLVASVAQEGLIRPKRESSA
ncbi:MAG TPA: acyl-CoA thioesterase II [Roseiarcus sp.]|nr:acyl-CoA thioesterase II [Roseiarcus sp.]